MMNCKNGHTLREIAELVEGEFSGDGEKRLLAAAPFEAAGPDDITFAGQAKYIKQLADSPAGCVLVPMKVSCEAPSVIRVKNPQLAFIRVLTLLYPPSRIPTGIHPAAVVGSEFSCGKDAAVGPGVVIGNRVTIGDRVQIHPNVVLGDQVEIGNDVIIYPNVSVLERCLIGSRTIINAGTVIGSDGYGFESDGERFHKIPQLGIVQIDDDVEIGAGNTIDRAAFDKTWIQSGVKTDNLVHIAHNVVVGENTLIVGQAGIAGSTTIGRNVILAARSAIGGHITIGDRAIIGAKAGVSQSVSEGAILSGFPGIPHRLWLRVQRAVSKLPELFKQVGDLEKRVKQIEKNPD
jgi:UDP-3-O-[3-hydroxymyristoyl] glucosamine N-acyltransferase